MKETSGPQSGISCTESPTNERAAPSRSCHCAAVAAQRNCVEAVKTYGMSGSRVAAPARTNLQSITLALLLSLLLYQLAEG